MTRAPIVVLGAMTRYPVAGIVWLTMQYVLGFRHLGFAPRTPRPFGIQTTCEIADATGPGGTGSRST